LGIVKRTEEAGSSVAVGRHAVEGDAHLVRHSLEVGYHAEDTDGAGQCAGVCHDAVRSTRDVVASRRGIASHRHDDGFPGLQVYHLVPDLFRAEGAAAGRVHTEDHSLDLLVFRQLAQVFTHQGRMDVAVATSRSGIVDAAFRIVDGNLRMRGLQCQ